jgi:hypothetical protein
MGADCDISSPMRTCLPSRQPRGILGAYAPGSSTCCFVAGKSFAEKGRAKLSQRCCVLSRRGASRPLPADAMPRQASAVEQHAEVLGLMPGEWVEVKSLPEILSTLDADGKLRGLEFLPGMQPFCGQRFKVFKRMATLYQEESGQVRRLKNTVLLNDVQCDGLLMKCDRSCYLFWREAWLKRVGRSQQCE